MNILTACLVAGLACSQAVAQDSSADNVSPTYPVVRMSKCYVETADGSLFNVSCAAQPVRDAYGNLVRLPGSPADTGTRCDPVGRLLLADPMSVCDNSGHWVLMGKKP